MAKEYVIEKAFRKTVSKEDKTPVEFEAHGKKMWPWMVKVEGEDFWFQKTTLENGKITPGDTIYGLFDEEQVTPKNGGQPFTVKKFVRMQRPDGSYDKVQARSGGESQPAQGTAQAGQATGDLAYVIALLEYLVGDEDDVKAIKAKTLVSGNKKDSLPEDEDLDKPIDLSELPF